MEQLSKDAWPALAPLMVVGMHRSGTSLAARLLDDLGVHMGLELEDNHEAVAFLRTNNEILALAGAHWARPGPFLSRLQDDRFVERCVDVARAGIEHRGASYGDAGQARAWGFKDPRTALTLSIWLRIFPEARVLHVIRSGVDVSSSLCRRELRRYTHRVVEPRLIPTPGAAFRLWQTYVEAGRRAVAAHEGASLTIRYEDLLASPSASIREIVGWLGWSDADVETAIRRVIAPSRPSTWAVVWLRWMERFGRLDSDLMEELGYRSLSC
jgi:hypothetical protein